MATEEEKNNQQDLNESKKETIDLTQQELGLLESLRRTTQSRVDSESTILDYIRGTNNVLNDQFKTSKNISVEKDLAKKVSKEILNINENLNTILQNELGLEKTSNGLAKTRQKLIKDQLTLQTLLNTQFSEDAELNFEINEQLKEQIGNIDKLLGKVKNVEEETKKIKDNFAVKSFSGLEKITKEIPILRKFTEAFSKATEAARLQAVSNKSTPDKRKKLEEKVKGDQQRVDNLQKIAQSEGKGIKKGALKEFGFGDLSGTAASAKAKKLLPGAQGDLSKSMKGLKALPKAIKPLISGLKQLASMFRAAMKSFIIVDLLLSVLQADKATADLAKSMNITYKNATKVREELTKMAAESGDNAISTQRLNKTLVEMQKTLGTNVMMNKENLLFATEMREKSNLTLEDQKGIFEISNATGKSMEDITGEVMSQAKLSSRNLGVILNEKEVLKSIKDVSAATTLSLGKNPRLISDAVTTAKSLGFELSKIEQISSSLLQFESSIEAELEAELLLGKNINLEKARQFALDNNLAGVAREIAKEAGTAAEFGNMNFLQQGAIAKAMGMNRDELAKTLFIGEQLKNVTGDQAEEERLILQRRIDTVGLAQTERELKTKSIKDLKEQQGIQDKFADALEKMKELFVALAPSILEIGFALVPILEGIGKVIKFIEPIMASLTGTAIGGIVGGPYGAAAGLAVGLAADISRGQNEGYEMEEMEDFISRPGQPIQKFRKDDIILGGTSLNPPMGNSTPTIPDSKIDNLISEIRNMNKRPIEVVSTLTMDGRVIAEQIGRNSPDQLGNGLNASNYNIQ